MKRFFILVVLILLTAGVYAKGSGKVNDESVCDDLQNARYKIDELFKRKDFKGVIMAGNEVLTKQGVSLCDQDKVATLYECIGDAYGGLDDYKAACENYIKALLSTNGVSASDGMEAVMRLYERLHIVSQLITASLRSHDLDGGIKYSLEFIRVHDDVKTFFAGEYGRDFAAPDFLAYSYYNIACAFALKNDRENALNYLKESIKANPKFKANMKKDTDLKLLWRDKRFKALTADKK
jgi:tetratricopeptide (TPR) repeat protein